MEILEKVDTSEWATPDALVPKKKTPKTLAFAFTSNSRLKGH